MGDTVAAAALINPRPPTLPLLLPADGAKPPVATIEDAHAFLRRERAENLAGADEYAEELRSAATRFALRWDVLFAQACVESGNFTSDIWQMDTNPIGLGVTGPTAIPVHFRNAREAARAHVVHMLVYVAPQLLSTVPNEWLVLDPRLANVFYAGYADKVRTTEGLSGKWAKDLNYGQAIVDRFTVIERMEQTPVPTPQPNPGGAPLPAGIVQKTSRNWTARTNGQKPVAIVYHITDDMNLANVVSWFQNPKSNASAHVVIDRDGTIYQFVSSLYGAWTNNDVKRPRTDIDWLNRAVDLNWIHGGPMSVNDYTLTIEHVGTPENPPTDAQYSSSIAISAYWRDRYWLTMNRGHLLRHADIDSVDRAYCPGPRFDLARVISGLGGDAAVLNP